MCLIWSDYSLPVEGAGGALLSLAGESTKEHSSGGGDERPMGGLVCGCFALLFAGGEPASAKAPACELSPIHLPCEEAQLRSRQGVHLE